MKQRHDSMPPAMTRSATASVHPQALLAAALMALSGVLAVLQALRARLDAFAPGEALLALLRGQISDARASDLGSRASADVVLSDAVADLPLIADAVIAGNVPGFGPAELHFTVDLAIELATLSQGLRRERGAQASASARKSESMHALSLRRTELYTLVSSVTPTEGEGRDAIEKRARVAGRARYGVVASLAAMGDCARELLQQAESEPALAQYYRDKSFTAERVQALSEPATAALKARTAHAKARARVSESAAAVNRIEGRLRDELTRLRQAVEAQRAKGVALPEVELRAIRGVGVVHSVGEPVTQAPTDAQPVMNVTPVATPSHDH